MHQQGSKPSLGIWHPEGEASAPHKGRHVWKFAALNSLVAQGAGGMVVKGSWMKRVCNRDDAVENKSGEKTPPCEIGEVHFDSSPSDCAGNWRRKQIAKLEKRLESGAVHQMVSRLLGRIESAQANMESNVHNQSCQSVYTQDFTAAIHEKASIASVYKELARLPVCQLCYVKRPSPATYKLSYEKWYDSNCPHCGKTATRPAKFRDHQEATASF